MRGNEPVEKILKFSQRVLGEFALKEIVEITGLADQQPTLKTKESSVQPSVSN